MVNMVNILPSKPQLVGMLTLAFTSKHCRVQVQPHRAACGLLHKHHIARTPMIEMHLLLFFNHFTSVFYLSRCMLSFLPYISHADESQR